MTARAVLVFFPEYKSNMSEEKRSLWEVYASEVEPWRRGRAVLIVIGVSYFVLQALSVWAHLALGSFEQVFALVTGCLIFWLLFYFIWIGVHWVRWLAGAWSGLIGFCWLIWGIRDSNIIMECFAVGNLFVATYYCLSPSVFSFAKRQAERRSWLYSIAVAAVFVLGLLAFFAGALGLFVYKAKLEREAHDFADDAFMRVFSDHDGEFFADHLTEHTLVANGGRAHAVKFIAGTRFNPGNVEHVTPSNGTTRLSYRFPATLEGTAEMVSRAATIYGPLQLHMRLIESDHDWKIESLWWD